MSLRDTDDGVELTIVVVGDATELRRRAHAALAGTYPVRPESRALLSRVRASMRDEPYGLVLDAVPIRPAELDSVRDDFRRWLDDLRSSDCD